MNVQTGGLYRTADGELVKVTHRVSASCFRATYVRPLLRDAGFYNAEGKSFLRIPAADIIEEVGTPQA